MVRLQLQSSANSVQNQPSLVGAHVLVNMDTCSEQLPRKIAFHDATLKRNICGSSTATGSIRC